MKRSAVLLLTVLLLCCVGRKALAAASDAAETACGRDCLTSEEKTDPEEDTVEVIKNGAQESPEESFRKAQDYGLLLSQIKPKQAQPQPEVSCFCGSSPVASWPSLSAKPQHW